MVPARTIKVRSEGEHLLYNVILWGNVCHVKSITGQHVKIEVLTVVVKRIFQIHQRFVADIVLGPTGPFQLG